MNTVSTNEHGFTPHPNIPVGSVVSAGFTLLEMVVSVGVVAVVTVVLSQVFFVTLRSNSKTEILKDIKQNGELAMETMVRLIQNAKRITSTCSSAGTSLTSISVINADDGQTTFGCSFDGSASRLASTSAQGTQYLTSDNVTLGGTSCTESSLSFRCFGGAGVPTSITVSYRLSQAGTTGQAFEESSESFQTSATMRNLSE